MSHETDGDGRARLEEIRRHHDLGTRCAPERDECCFLLAELERVEQERDAKWHECPECVFRFDASHVTQATGGYDCPACAESRLERDLAAALARVRELEGALKKMGHAGYCITRRSPSTLVECDCELAALAR